MFGKLEKIKNSSRERVIIVPSYSEKGIGTCDLDEIPEVTIRRLNSSERVDPEKTRKNLLASKLNIDKKNATFYSGESFRVKRSKFYEKLNEVISSPKRPYSTLQPVLSKDSSKSGLAKEVLKTEGFRKKEENIIDLGYVPVRNQEKLDMSKTTRFELPGVNKEELFGKPNEKSLNFEKIPEKTSEKIEAEGNKTPLFGFNEKNSDQGGFGQLASSLLPEDNSKKEPMKGNESPFSAFSNQDVKPAVKTSEQSLFSSSGGLFGSTSKETSLFKPEASSSPVISPFTTPLFGSSSKPEPSKNEDSSKSSLFGSKSQTSSLFPGSKTETSEKTSTLTQNNSENSFSANSSQSLFGNNSGQGLLGNNTGSSLFGSKTGTSSAGLFGNLSGNNLSGAGSSFGGSSSAEKTTSLFSKPNEGNSEKSLFSNTEESKKDDGKSTVFGDSSKNSASTPGSLFGTSATPESLFSSGQTKETPPATSNPSGSLFSGFPSNDSKTAPNASGSLFAGFSSGNFASATSNPEIKSDTPKPATSSSGPTSSAGVATSGNSLFGNSAGSSLFGANSGNGSFGANSGGLFGTKSGNSLFENKSGTGLFGGNSESGLFKGNNGTGLFGSNDATKGSLFGQSSQGSNILNNTAGNSSDSKQMTNSTQPFGIGFSSNNFQSGNTMSTFGK
jgi:hypothetical protein